MSGNSKTHMDSMYESFFNQQRAKKFGNPGFLVTPNLGGYKLPHISEYFLVLNLQFVSLTIFKPTLSMFRSYVYLLI
jgi:hypothetical protein